MTTLLERLTSAWQLFFRQLAQFGVVGVMAFVIDVGVFNALRFGGEDALLDDRPLTAKVVSSAVATIFSWLGNRYWTFRHTRRPAVHHEFLLFVVACGLGLGITLGCLWISHYGLGLRSPLADNIAANVVGLGLGTAFRFWAYKRFVFTHKESDLVEAVAAEHGHASDAGDAAGADDTTGDAVRPDHVDLTDGDRAPGHADDVRPAGGGPRGTSTGTSDGALVPPTR